jgi:uncharacterized membrane protein
VPGDFAQNAERTKLEPRWPGIIAFLAVSGLYTALPTYLIIGPRWLFFAIVSCLLIPTIISHQKGNHRLNNVLVLIVNLIVTIGLIVSVGLLIRALPKDKEIPTELLLSATSLWITNVLVFALWYWRLDAGGPNGRDQRAGHPDGAFLFPQMTLNSSIMQNFDEKKWSPNFVDYLFVSFNTSTAFSPTDVPILARWAKLMSMLQSLISLTVIVLLAARAVNIL